MKTVIIFGGTGGVGAYTSIRLIELGYRVIVVGHRKNDNGFFESLGAEYFSLDIVDKESFIGLPIKDVYAIIHLAGALPARMKGYNPQTYIDSNITGTLNVLEYGRKVNVNRIVYPVSFSDVSFLFGSITPISADANISYPMNNDHSVYVIAKNTGRFFVEHYSQKYGIKSYILRFPNIYLYHPNQTIYIDGVLRNQGMGNVLRQIMRGEDIELWGDPNRLRDMVYVKDCVQIIECCLTTKSNGGVFNVGTGIGTSRIEQINGMIDVFAPIGVSPKIIVQRDKPDSPQYIMDVKKTELELGYQSKYSYRDWLMDYKHEMETNQFEAIWGKESDYPLV